MKRKIVAGIILLAGICLLMYPVVGNIINVIHQNSVQAEYNEMVKQLEEETVKQIKSDAEEYNKKLASGEISVISTDEDSIDGSYDDGSGYSTTLDVGTDAIAFIKIPKISVELPIYRGTAALTLEKGVGHLRNSSLPVGGESTHCVLTGHTGMPSSMLFTDLTKMEVGDMFYIQYLDEILAYQVDQIKVVEPTDTSDLKIVPGKDYVTLLTCTPYGINSHRLLVRGERVAFNGEVVFGEDGSTTIVQKENTSDTQQNEATATATSDTAPLDESSLSNIIDDLSDSSPMVSVYGLYVPLWVVIIVPILVIIAIIAAIIISIKRSAKKKTNDESPDK